MSVSDLNLSQIDLLVKRLRSDERPASGFAYGGPIMTATAPALLPELLMPPQAAPAPAPSAPSTPGLPLAALPAPVPIRVTLAEKLSALRKEKGSSLEEIAQVTKIRPHYLEAIECGKFEKLPAGVFAVSYLRQYAEAIGSDPNPLLDLYEAQQQAEAERNSPPEPPPPLTWRDRLREFVIRHL